MDLKEINEKMQALRVKEGAIFEKGLDKLGEEDTHEIQTLEKELTDLAGKKALAELAEKRAEEVKEYEKPVPSFVHGSGAPSASKVEAKDLLLADIVMGSPAWKNRHLNGGKFVVDTDVNPRLILDRKLWTPDMEAKTLMERSAGWAPQRLRDPNLLTYSAQNTLDVLDIIPTGTTNYDQVLYMAETTFTNNASQVAEGSAVTDSALAYTQSADEIEKFSAWIPVTEEEMQDSEVNIQDIIENRLMTQVRLKLQAQCLTGSGTTPQLRGLITVAGQTQAKGADNEFDAIYKGMVKVMYTGRAQVSNMVFHSNDWQTIRLLQDNEGNYILGNPGAPQPQPMLWGVPVIINTDETENTVLVGDFRNYCKLYYKGGLRIDVSDSHSTYFTEGKFALKATLRVGLIVRRVNAFCTITGM